MDYIILDLHWPIFFVIFSITSILFIYFTNKVNKTITAEYLLLRICFIFYVLLIIKFAILPVWIFFNADILKSLHIPLSNFIQHIPFNTISSTIESGTWTIQILGNIILFAPVPIFIELTKDYTFNLKELLILGFKLTICLEFAQGLIILLTRYPSKVVDIDDIILNVAGIVAAYSVLRILSKVKVYQRLKQTSSQTQWH